MENSFGEENIKRGIDFSKRVSVNLPWLDGGTLNSKSLLFLLIVTILSIIWVLPVVNLNIGDAFSSSALLTLSKLVAELGFFTKDQFFLFLVVISLTFAPAFFYLFVRKNTAGNDLAAFVATLIYILPNPLFDQGLPLYQAILFGDGSHAVMFALIPLLLLVIQSFVQTGSSQHFVVAALLSAAISIIAPFAFFNLILIVFILTLAEGFLGQIRIKFTRFILLVLSIFSVSSFWYFPGIIYKVLFLTHIELTLHTVVKILPLAIPIVPIIGTILFLVFDQRFKLKPLFIGLSMFGLYYLLFASSKTLKINGVFTADRYLVELSFSLSILLSLVVTPFLEALFKQFVSRSNRFISYIMVLAFIGALTFMGNSVFQYIQASKNQLSSKGIVANQNLGISSLERQSSNQYLSLVANTTSFATLFIFIFIIIRYPVILGERKA